MKFLQIIAILFFIAQQCYAQNVADNKLEHKHIFRKPWIGNNKFLIDYLNKTGIDTIRHPLYVVPIKLWIYRSSDSSIATNGFYIKQLINNLNNFHRLNDTHIAFYVSDVKCFSKKKFSTFNYYTKFPFRTIINHNKKLLNIAVVEELIKPIKKYRNYHFTGSYNHFNNSVITIAQCHPSGICHEVGHYLGLKHPHKSYRCGKHRQESVSRTRIRKGIFMRGYNCQINGDALSDTYAQPNLNKTVDQNCNYIGNLTDRWGDVYQPQTDNIMSYPPNKNCRTSFTDMQKAVMLYNLEHKRKSKKWRFNDSENSFLALPDRYEPDFSPQMATTLNFNELQYHTLHSRISKKGKVLYDDVDWLKVDFQKVKHENLVIHINKKNKINTNLVLSFYDDKSNLIKQIKILESEIEIKLDFLSKQTYFFKIEPENQQDSEVLGYEIRLSL